MALNVISYKKSKETLKKPKLLILQCKFGSRAQKLCEFIFIKYNKEVGTTRSSR